MAEVTLTIAGRDHRVGCRDGEEAHLRNLGRILDEQASVALQATGGASNERTLLLMALILADKLHEAREAPAPPPELPPGLLGAIADHLEAVADALEVEGPNA